jgi:hypothetical protein
MQWKSAAGKANDILEFFAPEWKMVPFYEQGFIDLHP